VWDKNTAATTSSELMMVLVILAKIPHVMSSSVAVAFPRQRNAAMKVER